MISDGGTRTKRRGRARGRKGGNHSAASVLSGAANEPRMLWEPVPAGQILAVVLQHPSTQGSHAGAQTAVPLCSRCPNKRFNFNILISTLPQLSAGGKTSLKAEFGFSHGFSQTRVSRLQWNENCPHGWSDDIFLSGFGKYSFHILYLCSRG